MANNMTGLRVGSVVKDKVMKNHEAKVVSVAGEQLTLESLNQRDLFHYSEQKEFNESYKSFFGYLPNSDFYQNLPERPDFQFGRHYSEVELVKY